MQFDETFRAKLWTQESTGAWHFVTLPDELSARIRTLTTGQRKPFGSFHVKARTGLTAWESSLFADTKRGAFLLPVKADVRRKEKIKPGDVIEVSISFGLWGALSKPDSAVYRTPERWISIHPTTHTRGAAPMSVSDRLKAAGVTLPDARPPVANYVPYVVTGNLLFISGQVSVMPDGLIKGRLGEDMTVEQGQQAARACAINLIAQMQAALGDLERVTRVVKLGGFVNAAKDFVDIPKVVNGCSDLMVEAFGDKGRHARSAVACPVLPLGVAVEVDAVIEFK